MNGSYSIFDCCGSTTSTINSLTFCSHPTPLKSLHSHNNRPVQDLLFSLDFHKLHALNRELHPHTNPMGHINYPSNQVPVLYTLKLLQNQEEEEKKLHEHIYASLHINFVQKTNFYSIETYWLAAEICQPVNNVLYD